MSILSFFYVVKDVLIDQDVWTHDADEEVLKQGSSVLMAWKHLTDMDCSHNDISYIDESVVSSRHVGEFFLSHIDNVI